MGYVPDLSLPHEVSKREDRHGLQQHAHSIGYVAVPEALWERVRAALRDYSVLSYVRPDQFVFDDVEAQQKVIERERG